MRQTLLKSKFGAGGRVRAALVMWWRPRATFPPWRPVRGSPSPERRDIAWKSGSRTPFFPAPSTGPDLLHRGFGGRPDL